MRKIYLVLTILILSSCVEMSNKECTTAYLEADKWYVDRTRMAGTNQEAKDLVYREYLKKYNELDSKCK